MTRLEELARSAREEPELFWLRAADAIEWVRPPQRASDGDPRRPVWFPGAQLNTCHNAVDRHVIGGRGAQTALIRSPVTLAMASRVKLVRWKSGPVAAR